MQIYRDSYGLRKIRVSVGIKNAIGIDLAVLLTIPDMPLLRNKRFRNDLDHYDERLVICIKEAYPKRQAFRDFCIGPKAVPVTLHLRIYDPSAKIYTFRDRDLNLDQLHSELIVLQKVVRCPILKEYFIYILKDIFHRTFCCVTLGS